MEFLKSLKIKRKHNQKVGLDHVQTIGKKENLRTNVFIVPMQLEICAFMLCVCEVPILNILLSPPIDAHALRRHTMHPMVGSNLRGTFVPLPYGKPPLPL